MSRHDIFLLDLILLDSQQNAKGQDMMLKIAECARANPVPFILAGGMFIYGTWLFVWMMKLRRNPSIQDDHIWSDQEQKIEE